MSQDGRVIRSAPLIAAILSVVLTASACGDGTSEPGSGASSIASDSTSSTTVIDAAQSACGDAVVETVDPAALTHLLPGTAEPEYLTDPPTSGPHDTRPLSTDVLAEPLPRPRQVGVLEAGRILVQHRGLDDADRAALEALAGPDVVIAPNPDLPVPIVVTAWVTKMTCTDVDIDPIEAFVTDHAHALDGGHD
jgi:hypothetical protein